MKPKQKSKTKRASNVPKSRKVLRKEQRQLKKQRRHEYYTNRNKPGKYVAKPADVDRDRDEGLPVKKDVKHKKTPVVPDPRAAEIAREKREQDRLRKDMQKQRNKQLVQANVEEDRNIKRLEKQLKLNKRKTKSIPKSFASEGLDYLLEVCDPENIKSVGAAEQQLNDINDGFEEDFALMTGKTVTAKTEEVAQSSGADSSDQDEASNFGSESLSDEEDGVHDGLDELLNRDESENETDDDSKLDELESIEHKSGKVKNDKKVQEVEYCSGSESEEQLLHHKKRKNVFEDKKRKKQKVETEGDSDDDSRNNICDADAGFSDGGDNVDDVSDNGQEEIDNENSVGTWEDIYGRLRRKDGTIITENQGKYIPPAVRAKMESGLTEDKKRTEKLNRLKRQLKGLLNRLAEGNMHSISTQIEELYMNNSRNDMNDTLTNLMKESLCSNVLTPERLLLEHVMLITILHANVGTEVGAHFLQTFVKEYDALFNSELDVQDKTLDNVVHILAQLYNFRVYHSQLLYQVLAKLSGKFDEKCVECVLLVLKNVGFSLRKDDPLALKSLILELQKQATSVSDETKNNSRVKYMLDVLLAIKNNNMSKIPNYDTSYSEHLKKLLKSFVRKGNYVTQLNISLDDLLKADERGKWWVVGSAWTGTTSDETQGATTATKSESYSQKLLDLAKKQRMNTDTRRNIFCILMSAEDYLDAFEKLLRLGLKNQQEREIIHVILHCCLQEKRFNPYYAVLAQKFCEHDRKYQMTIKYSIWDKLKALTECSADQISHLAKLLTHLFIEKGLPISTLKIVQFSELDKTTLRFIRQILLGILLCEDAEVCLQVFEKVGQSDKLKMFRESLRLFIHHFMLRNLTHDSVPDEQKSLLKERSDMVEKVLTVNEKRLKL